MEPGLKLTERYRLVERLDGGGTDEVWRAWDEALNRPVAVKLPEPGRPPGDIRHDALHGLVVGAVRITHPAFVTIYDCDRIRNGEGRLMSYIVTAFLEGETLAGRTAREPLPVTEALECCAQIATALAAAHAAGVSHGDLRPEKIFLTPDGVRIVDLGMGPPAGDAGGEAADMLAFGAILVGCLSAPSPEDGPGPPEEVAELCSRCRSADPGERPGAAQAAEILTRARTPGPTPGEPEPCDATVVFAREDSESPQPDTPDGPGRDPRRDGTVFRVALTVTLVAVSLAAILVMADQGSLPGSSPDRGNAAPPLPPPDSPSSAPPSRPSRRGAGPPPASPVPVPAVFDTLGRLQPIVDSGRASGAIRSDVAVDLNNSITNLRNELAAGRTADAGQSLSRLREKIAVRQRERALDDDVAARLTDVLSNAAP